MKTLLAAAVVLAFAGNAHATFNYDWNYDSHSHTSCGGSDGSDCLAFTHKKDFEISHYNGDPKVVTGKRDDAWLGILEATGPVTITATFLGKEAIDHNTFTLGSQTLDNDVQFKSITETFGDGKISFSFNDLTTIASVANGDTFKARSTNSFAFLKGNKDYDFLIGYNDKGTKDYDYDDFVVGIKYVCVPVPEPETYAMMLAGLGLVGFASARRRNK